MVATTTAQTLITSLDEISNDKVYYFRSYYIDNGYDYMKTPTYSPENPEKLWCGYVLELEDDSTNPNQQYALLKHNENYYLYNVGAGKYVTHKNDALYLVDTPEAPMQIVNSEVGSDTHLFCFEYYGKYIFGPYPYSGYEDSGYMYCLGTNRANGLYSWAIYEAGDFESTELVAALPEQVAAYEQSVQDAKKALYETISAAEEIVNVEAEYYLYIDTLQLQTSNQNEAYYLSCNHPDESEGDISYLVDKEWGVSGQGDEKNNNFFHSSWHGTEYSAHWLDLDLGEGNEIDIFKFGEVTRNGGANDFPSSIEIQASNDALEYVTITTVTGLPQTTNTAWTSNIINLGESYRYLRFVVTTGTNRIYFHMEEFWLTKVQYDIAEKYSEAANEVNSLYEMVNTAFELYESEDGLKEEYESTTAELNELMQYIKDLISEEPDAQTLQLIEDAKAVLADIPYEIGYPGLESRATLQAVIDAATADPNARYRETITNAIDAFYNSTDVILPEDGKKYSFILQTRIDNYFYLNRSTTEASVTDSTGVATTVEVSNMVVDSFVEGQMLPETAAFTCRHNEDGTLTFIADNGQFLLYKDGTSSASGNAVYGIQAEEDDFTLINLIRIIPSNAALADAPEDFWGYVAWKSKRSDARGMGCIVVKTDGSGFDGASAPFYNDSYSSVFKVVEYTEDALLGVEDVEVEDNTIDVIYDLTGRKLESIVTPGIYIVNGVKTLVK